METQESKINPVSPERPVDTTRDFRGPQHGNVFGGVLLVIIGLVFLAERMGVAFPSWLFSWPMFLIVIGLYVGARHSFRNPVWIIPVVIGTLLLMDNMLGYDLKRLIWPIVIIFIGVFMMFRSRRGRFGRSRHWDDYAASNASEDVLDCVTVFGGVKKNIISKEFRGGEAVTVFGGTELNLLQADTPDRIVLELIQVFGGTKLIVPPHWKVQTEEMVTIFGGLNDKRPLPVQTSAAETKILVLKGTCFFGGIDIKSY